MSGFSRTIRRQLSHRLVRMLLCYLAWPAQSAVEVMAMLETLIVVLVILWLLGMVSSYTLGGFIHILLVVAIVVLLLRVIQGRRVV
jgi:hypothetical protein